jgi:hypothetical protein
MSSALQTEASITLPAPPEPMYPDVPWWAVLVTAIVFAFAGAAATYMMIAGSLPATGTPSGLVLDILVYMPHVMLLFGVLADMITYDGAWSIPSLVGFLSIFMNYIFRYFWFGIEDLVASATDIAMGRNKTSTSSPPPPVAPPAKTVGGGVVGAGYNGCNIQGFESIGSEYAPQTLVITATIFSYYCFDLIQNRGWVNAAAAIVIFLVSFGGHTTVLNTTTEGKGCQQPGLEPRSVFANAIRALSEGLLFGGTAYGIVQTYYPTRLPSATISPFPRRSIRDLRIGADGKLRDENGYPYVCLPNGQCVPDFGDKTSRIAFGSLANDTLGLGNLRPPGCPDPKCASGGATGTTVS